MYFVSAYDTVLKSLNQSITSSLQISDDMNEMTVLLWLYRRIGSSFSLRIGNDVVIKISGDNYIFNWYGQNFKFRIQNNEELIK